MEVRTKVKVYEHLEKYLVLTKEEHDKLVKMLSEFTRKHYKFDVKKINTIEFRVLNDFNVETVLYFKVEVEE